MQSPSDSKGIADFIRRRASFRTVVSAAGKPGGQGRELGIVWIEAFGAGALQIICFCGTRRRGKHHFAGQRSGIWNAKARKQAGVGV